MLARLLCCWECKIAQSHWEIVWQFLIKLNIHPYDPATPLLGIYPREMKHTLTQKPVHECRSFMHNCSKKQPQCPSVDEMVNAVLCVNTVEDCSAMKGSIYWYMQQHGWGSQGRCVEWKKASSKDYVLYDPSYMSFWKKQNWEQISGCWELGVGAGFDYKRATEGHLLGW